MTISIYDYTDYRCYLRDKFTELREKYRGFSYRSFNRRAGIKSSGFIKLVMDGKRNLGNEGIEAIVKGLQLSRLQADYFTTLVRFNQAKTDNEKNLYFQELSKRVRRAKPLQPELYALYTNWYYMAIYVLLKTDTEGPKTVDWLVDHISPSVKKRDIKQAVSTLLRAGLIEEEPDQGLITCEGMLTTPDQVKSLALKNFHAAMSLLASRAVREQPVEQREFSALSISTSKTGFEIAKREIQEFRKKLHALLVEKDKHTKDRAVQINFQMFHLGETDAE